MQMGFTDKIYCFEFFSFVAFFEAILIHIFTKKKLYFENFYVKNFKTNLKKLKNVNKV